MESYLYLSLEPEALVASMLAPEEFGAYMATGTLKQTSGQAMFFTLKQDFASDYFKLSDIKERCVPHDDGRPKHSVYLGIYRVLEHVPLEAIESLWLITAHGRALELKQGVAHQTKDQKHHLYREIAPVNPLIASSLGPVDFCRFITDPAKPIYVPRICMVELDLADLAEDPVKGKGHNLPYKNLGHIRTCLGEIEKKPIKTVDRLPRQGIIFRCIKGGIYIGDRNKVLEYPFPALEELEGKYNVWWRCANDSELQWTV
ncbi:MAG TPA: hypothetical protein VMC79_13545 [Rectinemataceae bacterium]|nr:hypothetical protein [Rectinemataceae bacterium]